MFGLQSTEKLISVYVFLGIFIKLLVQSLNL